MSELRQARALDIECEDCGRTRRLQRRELLELDSGGIRTFPQLGTRLVCRQCRSQKGAGKNITLKPRWFSHLRVTGVRSAGRTTRHGRLKSA